MVRIRLLKATMTTLFMEAVAMLLIETEEQIGIIEETKTTVYMNRDTAGPRL